MPKPIEGTNARIGPIGADPDDESQWIDLGFSDAIAFDEEPGNLPAWPRYDITELTISVTGAFTKFLAIIDNWVGDVMRLFETPVSRKTETPARSAMHAAYRAKTRNRRRRRR
jgi:hypothetical protein